MYFAGLNNHLRINPFDIVVVVSLSQLTIRSHQREQEDALNENGPIERIED